MATRLERVVLELQDNFSTGMTRAAANTALLNRELDTLDKQSVRTKRSAGDIDSSVTRVGSSADRSAKEIDKLSGRVGILADVAAILGPSLIPIGAVGIPAVTGLASQLGFTAIAAGTTVLAFQGMGDALKALDKAALEPTQANLQAAQIALEKLSPAARDFAEEIRRLAPLGRELRDSASEGFFPGALEGLQSLETILPRVEGIISAVSTKVGEIASDTGASLASDRWEPFLEFIGDEAPKVLGDLADIVGNTGHAMANLWMTFEPVNNDFSQWLVDSTEELDQWSEGLSQTEGFRDFIAYVEENGPKVADTFGAIANATVQIVEAAAPLGGPVLQGVEALANVIGDIADSDLGTPIFTTVAALALLDRGLGLFKSGRSGFGSLQTRFDASKKAATGFSVKIREVGTDLRLMGTQAQVAGARTERELLRANAATSRLKANLIPLGKGAGVLTGLAIAGTGVADSIGLSNTASLAFLGTIAGGPGAAAGGLIGAFLDAKDASKEFGDAMQQADRAIESGNVDDQTAALKRLRKEQEDIKNFTGVGDFFGDVGRQAAHPLATLGIGPSLSEQNEAKQRQVEFFGEIAGAIDKVVVGQDFMNHGFQATSDGIDNATQSAGELQKALIEVQKILQGRADIRSFEQTIIDFEDRAKKRADLIAQLAEAQKKLGGEGATPSEKNRINRLQDTASSGTAAERKKAREDLAALQETISTRTGESAKRAADEVARLKNELKLYANTLDVSTQAGLNNQAQLDTFVSQVLTARDSVKELQESPALKAGFLDAARDQYIKMATAFGDTAEHAGQAADKLGLVENIAGHKVVIKFDASGAIQIIDVVAEKLRKLQLLTDLKLNILTAENKRRDGGRDGDPDTPYWTGGFTGPGGHYEPKGIVHGNEVVLPDWVVAKDKQHIVGRYGFLPGMNQLRGYADGGFVTPFPQQTQRPQVIVQTANAGAIDLEALVDRVAAQTRPLIGHQTVMPHDYSEFEAQQNQNKRMASNGGARLGTRRGGR